MSHHLVLLDDVNNSSPARDGISVHCIHHRLKTSTIKLTTERRSRAPAKCTQKAGLASSWAPTRSRTCPSAAPRRYRQPRSPLAQWCSQLSPKRQKIRSPYTRSLEDSMLYNWPCCRCRAWRWQGPAQLQWAPRRRDQSASRITCWRPNDGYWRLVEMFTRSVAIWDNRPYWQRFWASSVCSLLARTCSYGTRSSVSPEIITFIMKS